MKIAAITRFKNGELFTALKQAGMSQSQLAREVGICPSFIGRFANLKERPCAETMDTIQRVLGTHGVYLDLDKAWPKDFKPLKKALVIEQVKDVQLDQLAYRDHLQLLNDNPTEHEQRLDALNQLVSEMPHRERLVLESLYGLNDCEPMDGEQLSQIYGVSRSRIHQIKIDAQKKLRKAIPKYTNPDAEEERLELVAAAKSLQLQKRILVALLAQMHPKKPSIPQPPKTLNPYTGIKIPAHDF